MSRTASCSCGQLTATAEGEPVRISMCHCYACQRRSGSVFAVQARWPRSAVTTRGEHTTYARVGDSGNRSSRYFCPHCGSTVFYTVEAQPDLIAIAVGAFADQSFPPPKFSVYEDRMHPWVATPEGVEHLA